MCAYLMSLYSFLQYHMPEHHFLIQVSYVSQHKSLEIDIHCYLTSIINLFASIYLLFYFYTKTLRLTLLGYI